MPYTAQEIIIQGEVKRQKRFDSGYCILTIQTGKKETFTVVGEMPPLSEGMNVKATVTESKHPKYGDQFKVVDIEQVGFDNEGAIIAYLSGPSFPRLGPAFAKMIVGEFGMKTLETLDKNPDAIYSIAGIDEGKVDRLLDIWAEEREQHRSVSALMKFGLTPQLAGKVYKHFGNNVIEILDRDPYRLTEVPGVGFRKADEAALKSGVARNSPQRISAGLQYVLEQGQTAGHCYLTQSQLARTTLDLFDGDVLLKDLSEGLKELRTKGAVCQEDDRWYLTNLFNAERQVRNTLLSMIKRPLTPLFKDMDAMRACLKELGITHEITLAPLQEEAVMNACNSRVAIITGGPGCGKTTIVRTICQLFDHFGVEYKLCSPTGRAAKRLTESVGGNTGEMAHRLGQTIHKLLVYSPQDGGFYHREGRPIDGTCAIVDESSMVDILLFRHLLNAMTEEHRLIMVGDANQLPSVGPGNVLRDLIGSGAIPTVKLEQVFRQSAGSSIITVAHDILHGIPPQLPSPKEAVAQGSNCMFAGAEDAAAALHIIRRLITVSLPGAGFKPQDIQVLTPMWEKGMGVNDINPVLQEALNPQDGTKVQIQAGPVKIFREGDRVMQTKNNYDKGIFNGDQGVIQNIIKDPNSNNTQVFLKFPDIDDLVEYDYDELEQLVHSYAITFHKSQGSEYPAVILVMHNSHWNMLQRNLFYTGLTRGKKVVVVVGARDAVRTAVDNDKEQARNTTLADLMRNK